MAAAPTTQDDLFALVSKSGLVDEQRMASFCRQLPQNGDAALKPRAVADQMICQGLLTQFQAEQLLQGRHHGFTLGKYRLLERLGQGGMGAVYLAVHVHMRRRVALKVLPPKECAKPAAVERFYREARAAAALTHPNIARAYDVDNDDRAHFLVMEYIDGCSLQDLVTAHGQLAVPRALYYLRQAALGLQHAHQQGIVHRDIKPGNLMLDRQGTIRILDMGLARFFEDSSDNLTRDLCSQSVLGTADYIAPEQALDSHDVDIRADIYSLGMTGYFLLTGASPFGNASTTTQKLLFHQMKQPRPIREIRSEVPEEVAAILTKMYAKEKEKRFQTPAEVAAALELWTTTPPPPPAAEEMPKLCPAAESSTSICETPPPAPRTAIKPRTAGAEPVRSGPPTLTRRPERAQSVTLSPVAQAPISSPAVSAPPQSTEKKKDRKKRREREERDAAKQKQKTIVWVASLFAGAVIIGSFLFYFVASQALKDPPSAAASSPPSPAANPQPKPQPRPQPSPAPLPNEVRRFNGHGRDIETVAFSPDGKRILTGSWDKTLRLWDVVTGGSLRTFQGHDAEIHCVTFLPNGKQALSASWDKTVRLWDIGNGQAIRTFTGHTDRVHSVAVTPDGRLAASGAGDKTVRIWAMDSGSEIGRLEGHTDAVWSVAFSPSGHELLSGSQDKTASLWDVATRREIRRFEGHTARISSVAFAKNGKWILTGSDDGTAKIWDVATGTLVRTLIGSPSAITAVALSADARFAMGGANDGIVVLWTTDNGRIAKRFEGQSNQAALGVAFSPDGSVAVSGHRGKVAVLWNLR